MKKALSLIACAAMLFTACSKDSSDPVPTPVPTSGTGKFLFSMDSTKYKVDTLFVSYKGTDGMLKTQTIPGRNSWSSPEIAFQGGTSIRGDVRAVGSVVGTNQKPQTEGITFKITSPNASAVTIKATNSKNETGLVDGTRFEHVSFLSYSY